MKIEFPAPAFEVSFSLICYFLQKISSTQFPAFPDGNSGNAPGYRWINLIIF